MSESLAFRLVDAFADYAFQGNPAGVILDADALDDTQMLAIAREVNASETAFVTAARGPDEAIGLRWFTPTVEVGFCGHATLAAAHAVAESAVENGQDIAGLQVRFRCRAGALRVARETTGGSDPQAVWWLDMPDPQLRPDNTNPMKTCELLGLTMDDLHPAAPIVRSRDDDLVMLIRGWQRLQELRPNLAALEQWSAKHGLRGICVATLDTLNAFTHVASRFFAPAAGVPEDPVTGSVHGPLGVLIAQHGLAPVHDGRVGLNCWQGVPGGRGGLVRVLVSCEPKACSVRIGGTCHTALSGAMRRPREGRRSSKHGASL